MNMLSSFQDSYWNNHPQKEVFRHRQAVLWLGVQHEPIADIGCGDGFFLRLLRDKGLSAWGVDVSAEAIQACHRQGLVAEIADFGNGQLPGRVMKTAVFLDVLEHLLEPEKVLRALCERGVEHVIISVPNFSSAPARWQALHGIVPENNQPKKGHVYWFNAATLETVLQKTGWRVERRAHNTFWEQIPCIGYIMKFLAGTWPSLFALSFLVFATNDDAVRSRKANEKI